MEEQDQMDNLNTLNEPIKDTLVMNNNLINYLLDARLQHDLRKSQTCNVPL